MRGPNCLGTQGPSSPTPLLFAHSSRRFDSSPTHQHRLPFPDSDSPPTPTKHPPSSEHKMGVSILLPADPSSRLPVSPLSLPFHSQRLPRCSPSPPSPSRPPSLRPSSLPPTTWDTRPPTRDASSSTSSRPTTPSVSLIHCVRSDQAERAAGRGGEQM